MADVEEITKVTQADLELWYLLAEDLKKLKFKESLLRKRIFNFFFPKPKEGTNSHDLDAGYVLKASFAYDRKVDEAAMNALKKDMKEAGINIDKIYRWKPELAKAEYNKLTAEQKKLVDQTIDVKPGSPSLSIVLPAAKAEKGGRVKASELDESNSDGEPDGN